MISKLGDIMRICKKCMIEKPIEKFVKQGNSYRYKCKECLNSESRTGKPRSCFPKGHKPWNAGKKLSEEEAKKCGKHNIGRKHSLEEIEKRAKKSREYWSIHATGRERRSSLNRKWAKAVYDRDGNKCQNCGTNQKLNAHHIVPWKEDEDLRFELSNGITYCASCHHSIEKKGKISGMKGKNHSNETKKKISDSLKLRNQ